MESKMKNRLTKKQTEAYLLRSGEFQGLSRTDSAKAMGVTERAFNLLLERAEKKCPHIFPMLTKQEANVLGMLDLGWVNYDIANELGVSLDRVSQIKGALHEKGRAVACCKQIKMLQYAPHMDNKIREKF